MGGIAQAIAGLLTWFGARIAAQLSVKIAIIAAVSAVFAAIWLAMAGALSALLLLVPEHGFTPFLLQFMPDRSAIGFAGAAYWGTAITVRSLEYWRMAFSLAASKV